MNIRMKNKHGRKNCLTGRKIALMLCLVLLGSLAAVPAFADDTYVVIGGTQTVANGTASGFTSGGTVSSGLSSTIGSNGIVIGAPISGTSSGMQQTVVANGNGDTFVVVSDGVKSSTVTVATTANGTVIGNTVSNGTAQTVAISDAGITVAAATVTGLRAEIFEKTNAFRVENGLNTLSYNDDLQAAANTRAQESARQFNHVRPDGSEAHTVVTVDYHVTGENLIQAENSIVTSDILMETWKNSGTHRMNLLHPSYTSMAVGVYQENGMTFVSQVFIG